MQSGDSEPLSPPKIQNVVGTPAMNKGEPVGFIGSTMRQAGRSGAEP
jgi:hypothetical protein